MQATLHIVAQAPLAFPERKPGVQFRESLPYLPGATLFGALCSRYFAIPGYRSEQLVGVRCHNAYPARDGDRWVRPLPVTAIRPKGAKWSAPPEEGDTEPHDSLVSRVCWEQQRPAAFVYAPTDDEGRPWEAVGRRFYTLRHGRLEPRSVNQRVLTRVAINRRRGTAEDQRLYSPLVLSEVNGGEPTRFHGSVVLPDGDQALLAALRSIDSVGGRQSSGLGSIELIVPDQQELDTAEAIADRIARLTERFRVQATRYESLGGTPWPIEQRAIFTVNLLSDAILLDQGWLPTNELTEGMLLEVTEGAVRARLVRAFTTTAAVGGWNVTWQRPKPSAIATTMGSVFVFQSEQPLDDAACDALLRLQSDGIGERRQEGYGHIRICDDFHIYEEAR